MLYSNFMVMSFPFITVIEKNERQKKLETISLEKPNIPSNIHEKSQKVTIESTAKPQQEKCPKNYDMVCLSNLEEIVFYTSSSRCLLSELKLNSKPSNVDYDKYLDFFE